MPDPLPSDARIVAIASFENTAPVIARPPRSILFDPADAVYKSLKAVVANLATSTAPSARFWKTDPLKTRRRLSTVLKYKSPSVTLFPKPSEVGLDDASPKYNCKKLFRYVAALLIFVWLPATAVTSEWRLATFTILSFIPTNVFIFVTLVLVANISKSVITAEAAIVFMSEIMLEFAKTFISEIMSETASVFISDTQSAVPSNAISATTSVVPNKLMSSTTALVPNIAKSATTSVVPNIAKSATASDVPNLPISVALPATAPISVASWATAFMFVALLATALTTLISVATVFIFVMSLATVLTLLRAACTSFIFVWFASVGVNSLHAVPPKS